MLSSSCVGPLLEAVPISAHRPDEIRVKNRDTPDCPVGEGERVVESVDSGRLVRYYADSARSFRNRNVSYDIKLASGWLASQCLNVLNQTRGYNTREADD